MEKEIPTTTYYYLNREERHRFAEAPRHDQPGEYIKGAVHKTSNIKETPGKDKAPSS